MKFSSYDRVATFSCAMQLMPIPWDFEGPPFALYGTICNYEPAFGSWTHCVNAVLTEQGCEDLRSSAVDWANFLCARTGGGITPHLSYDDFWGAYENATNYLAPITTVPVNYPTLLDNTTRRLNIHAAHSSFANLDLSNSSAMWMYYYLALMVACMALCRIRSVRSYLLSQPWVNSVRSRLVLPAWKHTQRSHWALGGFCPSSLESTLLVGFFVVHAICLCANYSIDRNEYLQPLVMQYLQGVGNRSGILAFALLPIIIICSARFELIQRLMNVRYTTMLVFHRWTGRLMMVDSIIHSIAFFFHVRMEGEYAEVSHRWFWISGVIGTVLACVIVVGGVGYCRANFYEAFLLTHIAMALVFFYMCYEHVVIFGWSEYIVCSVLLWLGDRLTRLALIAWQGGVHYARVSELDDELIVVTIPKPKHWRSFPCQYAFVYFLHPKMFWQSHPFTISDVGDLRIVIAVKSGATKLLSTLSDRHEVPVLLEGPYGHPLEHFDSVLLIAGGSGIPGPLSLAERLGNSRLVIVARDTRILDAYEEQLRLVEVPKDIYLTRDVGTASGVNSGRPDINSIVESFISDLSGSGAVVCCGPPALNDQTRNAVARCLQRQQQAVVEYIEEYQVW